jgi:calcineurin-like phosphoesterase family protein
MTQNVFLVSDTHWGHKNLLGFKRADGSPLRHYTSIEEMDEALIENWNKVVKPADKVYHLGDVAMGKRGLAFVGRCNGNKILIKGNHDQEDLSEYIKYFKDVRAIVKKGEYVFSHVPIHPDSLTQRWGTNVHGHLHDSRVLLPNSRIDKRYICVAVEHTNYTPIALEDVERLR